MKFNLLLRRPMAVLIFRLFSGGFFALAGTVKMGQPANLFANQIKSFGILPNGWETPAAYVLPWIELVSGVFLFVGIFAKQATLLVGAQLATFSVALAAAIVLGRAPENCGCFPGVNETPAQALALDVFLIAWLVTSYRGLPGDFSLDGWLVGDPETKNPPL